MNKKSMKVAAASCLALLLAAPALGQVVRETDTNSIAGILDAWNTGDSFTFSSRGNVILFADVDSEIYQVQGRRGGDHSEEDGDDSCGGGGGGGGGGGDCGGHELVTLQEDDNGGCGDDEGGPGGLCLQVFDPTGTMICWADRPARPGWQRDPALACPLPSTQTPAGYLLRVGLKEGGCGPGGHGGHEPAAAAASLAEGPGTPYVVNWSLRRIASDGALGNQSNR